MGQRCKVSECICNMQHSSGVLSLKNMWIQISEKLIFHASVRWVDLNFIILKLG